MTSATTAQAAETARLDHDDLQSLVRRINETSGRLEVTHQALGRRVAELQRELAAANAKLRRSEALAGLGEMAAGIAHEIRNPLASIMLYVQMLGEDLADRPDSAGVCRKIDCAVRSIDAIVRDVLHFARRAEVRTRPTDLADLVGRVLQTAEGLLSDSGVTVERAVPAGLVVEIDPGLMQQALSNLLRNAVEAMQESGTVSPRLRIGARARRVRGNDGEVLRHLVVVIEDSGPGVPAAVVDRMFNPFFTTRETGTGLGLAIVHRIVDAHQGWIDVSRSSLGGARFELGVPWSDDRTEIGSPLAPAGNGAVDPTDVADAPEAQDRPSAATVECPCPDGPARPTTVGGRVRVDTEPRRSPS